MISMDAFLGKGRDLRKTHGQRKHETHPEAYGPPACSTGKCSA